MYVHSINPVAHIAHQAPITYSQNWFTSSAAIHHVTPDTITKNLLSVQKFTHNNHAFIEFQPSYFVVKDSTTRTPLLCEPIATDYHLPVRLCKSSFPIAHVSIKPSSICIFKSSNYSGNYSTARLATTLIQPACNYSCHAATTLIQKARNCSSQKPNCCSYASFKSSNTL